MVQLFSLPSHCLKIKFQALESEMHNVIMAVIVNFLLEQSKEQSGITAPFLFGKKNFHAGGFRVLQPSAA